MKYNFDDVVQRRGTYSVKYNMAAHEKSEDTIPMWVADMDFRSPPCVAEALDEAVKHGIFGYSTADSEYFDVLKKWFDKRFDWKVEQDWLVKTSGVIPAVYIAISALSNEGDGVLVQQPVYHPFANAVQAKNRRLFVNELVFKDNKYSINFDDFEEKIAKNNIKIFVLCNPHNPIGRVWTVEELIKMGDICLKHGVTVIADEIHQDFIYTGYRHTVFANIKPEYKEISITCTAPSKTFNLAALQLSNIFIPNAQIRKKFMHQYKISGMSQPSLMGIAACKAAYAGGEEWIKELVAYLEDNIAFLCDFLAKNLPQVKLVEPQGTYLMWLDFSGFGIDDAALNDFLVNEARLWLIDGATFGAGGKGFQRMNIACPRLTLKKALERLAKAAERIKT